jgi:hypothetical protein
VIQGSHAIVTFRLQMKTGIGGDLWASVASLLEVTSGGSTFGVWCEFSHFGSMPISNIAGSFPQILAAGFPSNPETTTFTVNSGSGPRDTFHFRFGSSFGAQQVIFAAGS